MTLRNTPRIIITAFAVAATACSPSNLQAAPLELCDGVLVDADAGRIYLMSPDKTVQAVQVTDGAAVWRAPQAAKPLSLANGRLVCQAEGADEPNQLNVVVLDANEGGRQLSASAVPLPQNVAARVDDGLTDRFRARASTLQEDAFITWQYQAIPMKGAPTDDPLGEDPDQDPDPDAIPAVRVLVPAQTTGTIRLNVRTGRAAPVAPGEVPPAVIDAQAAGPRRPPDAAADPRQRLSNDGRHTLRSHRFGDPGDWEKYEWTLIDNQTGAEVGKLRSHLSQSAFVVVGSLALVETAPFVRRTEDGLVEEPRSIRAYDMRTGQTVWSRPVRDTTYRGPFPP